MKNTLLSLFLIINGAVYAQNTQIRSKHFNIKKNVAIQGYDPVSYFNSKPEEGDDDISLEHKGIKYYFVSSENRNTFKSNPEKYEPQYGGWCAYALGETGEKVKIDPETYKIVDDKLYLFYNFWGTNTLKSWNKNESSLKEKGDQNWAKIIN
ncbi:MAG: YHS domain-containing (seleno)protein [Bacteroidota bacterium]